MDDDIEIIHRGQDPEDESELYEFRSTRRHSVSAWKAKLIFWAMIVAGIAVGTLLFLFFITLFIYFFVPLFVLFSLWYAFKAWQARRGR